MCSIYLVYGIDLVYSINLYCIHYKSRVAKHVQYYRSTCFVLFCTPPVTLTLTLTLTLIGIIDVIYYCIIAPSYCYSSRAINNSLPFHLSSSDIALQPGLPQKEGGEILCDLLLCDPGWCVHKSDVQNKWDDNTHNT